MLQTKTTKRGIIDRLINLDKATMIGKKLSTLPTPPKIPSITRDFTIGLIP